MSQQERDGVIANRLLLEMINDQVSESLGALMRRAGDMLKKSGNWSEDDKKAARLMILEHIRNSSGDFYLKMKDRIERENN